MGYSPKSHIRVRQDSEQLNKQNKAHKMPGVLPNSATVYASHYHLLQLSEGISEGPSLFSFSVSSPTNCELFCICKLFFFGQKL